MVRHTMIMLAIYSLCALQHWAAGMKGLGLQLPFRRQVAPQQGCEGQWKSVTVSELTVSELEGDFPV
jgi:hypothetical protein